MNLYALYDGEFLITDGTLKEIAAYTGLMPGTVKWYGTPSGQRKGNMALIKLEEDDNMFVGSHTPRSKRSHSVYAPTLTNDGNERTEDVKITHRHIELKPFKFNNRYINSMLDEMFRGW